MSDDPKRVKTPLARLSFPHLFKRARMDENQEAKFSCNLIFEDGTDLSALKRAAMQAIRDKWGDKPPKKLRTPFRDGNDMNYDGYEDATFISCRSSTKPGVIVGRDREVCTDESEIYGGCYVVASVTAFAYDTSGNKGVSFALNNVWKVRDGEAFGNARVAAEDDFADHEVDEDAFGEDDTASSLL